MIGFMRIVRIFIVILVPSVLVNQKQGRGQWEKHFLLTGKGRHLIQTKHRDGHQLRQFAPCKVERLFLSFSLLHRYHKDQRLGYLVQIKA